jgi:RHS repeat-associated protein
MSCVGRAMSDNSYLYDNNGNRTGTGIATLANNELSSASSISYLYDPEGNRLVTYAGGTSYNDYAFDNRDRMTNIWAPNAGQSVTYAYNPQNQRIEEKDFTSTSTVYSEFAYDGDGNLLLQMNNTGTLTHLYMPDPTGSAGSPQAGGVAPLAQEDASGNVTWLLPSQNGSVQDVIAENHSGAMTSSDRVLFDSFGNKKITDSGTPSLFGFQGMEQSLTVPSGVFALDDDDARWYDPATETFTSADPLGFAAGENQYRIDGNNPVTNDDPSGLMWSSGVANEPVAWSQPISQANLAPQAGIFSTGQTPLWAVPGTSYEPVAQQIARESEAASSQPSAPALSASDLLNQEAAQEDQSNRALVQQVWQQTQAEQQQSDQQQQQIAASAQEQAAQSAIALQSLAADENAQAADQLLTEGGLADLQNQAEEAQPTTLGEIGQGLINTISIAGLIAPPVFGIAGLEAGAGSELLGGGLEAGTEVAGSEFAGSSGSAITRPIYPPGGEPVPGFNQAMYDQFNPIIEQAYANNPAGSELLAARGSGNAAENESLLAGSIRNVNPTGGTMNCVNCSIATDATLAGNAASALPGSATPISVLEDTFGGQFQPVSGPMQIGSILSQSGNGARGIVFGESLTGDVGHVFNVINKSGEMQFLDGQVGGEGLSNFDNFQNFQFLQTHPGTP